MNGDGVIVIDLMSITISHIMIDGIKTVQIHITETLIKIYIIGIRKYLGYESSYIHILQNRCSYLSLIVLR